MGMYLNNAKPFILYKSETEKPYFIDKTMILAELFQEVQSGNSSICVTRPRRFGKTVMANMIASFFSKENDMSYIFDSLKIANNPNYLKYKNQYDVIYIDFSKMPRNCNSYHQYINWIEDGLIRDLMNEYPNAKIDMSLASWEAFYAVFDAYNKKRFIFVLDEWDSIFHKKFITDDDRKYYIDFLAGMFKDQPYVSMTYMTGVLPIAKYSSGSTINNFDEYIMGTRFKFSEYFGFTEEEIDELLERYYKIEPNATITKEDLEFWYDGYTTVDLKQMYNPRSVVKALSNNELASYWTSSGPYSELANYIVNDIDGVKNDIALMISGEEVALKMEEYAVTAMQLRTKDEIFSAMVMYGFLSYNNQKKTVCIPNKELMNEFERIVRKDDSFGYIYRLAKASDRMLKATLNGDTKTMEELLEFVHNTETPILAYNSEIELSAIVNLIYLSARDYYRVEREDKAGIGYVDFIFYPYNKKDDCIILELKVDKTPEIAIQQIKDKQYALKFEGKIAERKQYTGRILAVGISYSTDKASKKKHHCKVEVL